MAKAKNRVLTVDGCRYVWNRKHIHKDTYVRSPCVERLMVYLADQKTGPLRISFHQDDGGDTWVVGYPNQGVIWNRTHSFNLNEPGVVTSLIRVAIARGWEPSQRKHPYDLNGIELLNDLAPSMKPPPPASARVGVSLC